MKRHFILIALICSIFVACGPKPELPTVTTHLIDEITDTTALCTGEIVDNGNADIIAKGFCWSTEQNPTLEDNSIAGTQMAELLSRNEPTVNYFSAKLKGLTAATKYYVRAYATNSEGTAYGDNISFTTLEKEIEKPEVEYEYVDLGFPSGVKWATHNFGATTPEGYGEYYAWGEIETKETYESSNCSSYYKDLGDISGNPEYDVVAAEWGGGWRSPRLADMYELVTQCDWIWTNVNGINGFNVVSKINGFHIFLPAAGFMNTPAATAQGTEGVLDQGVVGAYWTTTPYSEEIEGGVNSNTKACFLDFSSAYYITDWGLRRNGFSIRPVMD